MLISQIGLGTPRPAVAVESGSMLPNIGIGDVVIIQSAQRTQIISHTEGTLSGYTSFNEYGDVILYRKFGSTEDTPIIHRAMYWVEEGEPMWSGGSAAPHSGYITKGDNNRDIDQKTRTSKLQPVKEEWIIGGSPVAYPLGRISLTGCTLISTGLFQSGLDISHMLCIDIDRLTLIWIVQRAGQVDNSPVVLTCNLP